MRAFPALNKLAFGVSTCLPVESAQDGLDGIVRKVSSPLDEAMEDVAVSVIAADSVLPQQA